MRPFVSIVYPVRDNLVWFSKSIDSFVSTTTNKKDVEILLKVDSDEDCSPYINILRESGFNYKLIISDRLSGFRDIQKFQTYLCKISIGDFIIISSDDLIMHTDDWVSKLKPVYSLFDDHIMVCAFSKIRINKYGTKKCKVSNKIPVVSRQWFKYCGYISPARQTDKYLYQLGTRINRYLCVHGISISFNLSQTIKKKHLNRYVSQEGDTERWSTSLDFHTKELMSHIIPQKVNFPEGICFSYIKGTEGTEL